jgi:hypothetical protein
MLSNFQLQNKKDKNLNFLLNNIKDTTHQSKYWLKRNLDVQEIYNFNANQWFGGQTKYNWILNYFRLIIYYFCYGSNCLRSDLFKKVKQIKKKFNLDVDHDTIRHIIILNYLKKKVKNHNIKKICIIGDGRLNGLITSFVAFPNAKYILINLPQVQMAEYLLLKKFNLFQKKQIQIPVKKCLFSKKITLLITNQKKIIEDVKADLFIDINAFQEMNNKTINFYLKIIKKSKSLFYSYNRKKKNINEKLNFDFSVIYKKNKNSILMLEEQKLITKYFLFKYPFIHKIKNKHLHCLLKFK